MDGYDVANDGKCPVMHGASPPRDFQGQVEPGLVAEPVEPQNSAAELSPVQSHGQGLQLR